MENASKALIIAGAILISIVLIGVGVLIVNSAQGIFGQGSILMSQQEIDAFNSQFLVYEGRQSGTAVRSLLGKVSTHNITYQDDLTKQIAVFGKELVDTNVDASNLSELKQRISLGKTYNVKPAYNGKTGLIVTLEIEEL